MSDPILTKIDAFLETHNETALSALAELCAIPSVSAKKQSLEPCAEFVVQQMQEAGLEARTIPVLDAPPIAYGTYRSPIENAPTVLFYNHYDVQPAEPLELWESDPFTLTFRDGKAFARGVGDDKGHIISRLLALKALREAYGGALPFHVKFVAEGEEEVGSPHIGTFMESHKEELAADYCIWEEGGVNEAEVPFLYCGMRGIAYFELHVKTIAYDAHSGVGGSLLPNAAWRLVWALSRLKDRDERILLPGHYDKAHPATPRDLELLAALPSSEVEFRTEYGLEEGGFLGGAKTTGVEYERRAVFEPTLTVCGLDSGWQGAGAKTVLPSGAHAKMDFRLVPDQDPQEVYTNLRAYLDAEGFSDIEIRYLGGQRPARVDPDHPLVRLASDTAEEIYGKPAAITPIVGGSGPMWWFSNFLGLPVTSPGIEYPGVRAHAPNENIRLADFVQGTRHLALLLHRIPTHLRDSRTE
jgi:acetylornithine deacetylase/succinyl-diaminopimelate desuccinylase-like protein